VGPYALQDEDEGMSGKRVLQINAVLGVTSVAVSAAMTWLVLTQPVQVASAVADRNVSALLRTVGDQLVAWFHALLRFL
jgi:hypothetical protein